MTNPIVPMQYKQSSGILNLGATAVLPHIVGFTLGYSYNTLDSVKPRKDIKYDFKIPETITIEKNSPVYVKKIDGVEQLIYRTTMMKMDQKYDVKWNGEHHVLIKTKNGVDFYKFIPDGD